MTLPPGIVYLGLNFHYLIIPPACVYTIDRLVVQFFECQIPRWLFILACMLAFPTAFTTVVLYKLHVDESEAAAHGAVLPPCLPDKYIGGYETLSRRLAESKSVKYIGEFLNSIREQHGNTVNMRTLFENKIFTCEPENIKMILATEFDGFEKGDLFHSYMTSLLGTGVFNSDGETWKFHRAMTRPFFSKERIGHFNIFDRHAEDAIGQTKTRARQGYPIDFQDMVSRFTLDSATDFLFGNNVRSLSAGLPYPDNSPLTSSYDLSHPANVFAQAFDRAQKLSTLRARYGSSWPLLEFWKDNVKVYRDIVDKFIDPILAEAIAKKKAIDTPGMNDGVREVKDGETLLDHLVNYTEDPKILKDETLNIMIAGRDTTAATLTFIIYMLAEHPEVMIRLREEIMQMVGSSRRPTYDDLRDMKYMRAVINETLRLFPPVPFNVRMTTRPAIWPSKTGGKPYYIPPRTRAQYSVFLMHRRKDLWGPDALDFDPNRWLDQRLHKYLTPNPFIFLPFNAGPRICLGQQFAYNEISFFLIRFLQSFSSVSLAPDAQPSCSRPPADWANAPGRKGIEKIVIKSHLTMCALNGLWVRLEEGNDAETL